MRRMLSAKAGAPLQDSSKRAREVLHGFYVNHSLGRACCNWAVAGGDGELIVLSLSAGPSGSVFLWGRCISVMGECSRCLFQAITSFMWKPFQASGMRSLW